MNRPIPEEIVAALDDLGALLGAWCEQGRDQPLASHEASVLELVRRVLPRLLEAVVGAATSGLAGRLREARQPCPGCGKECPPWEPGRRRQVVTQCGPIALERPWYHCRGCRRGWSVVETVLGEVRHVGAGAEAWFFNRLAALRGGFSANTAGDKGRAWSVGGSVGASGFFVDAFATLGSDATREGWGISARIGF